MDFQTPMLNIFEMRHPNFRSAGDSSHVSKSGRQEKLSSVFQEWWNCPSRGPRTHRLHEEVIAAQAARLYASHRLHCGNRHRQFAPREYFGALKVFVDHFHFGRWYSCSALAWIFRWGLLLHLFRSRSVVGLGSSLLCFR